MAQREGQGQGQRQGRLGRRPSRAKAVSLLPAATDCIVAVAAHGALVGRTHECTDPAVASVLVCTMPKLAPTCSLLDPGPNTVTAAGPPSSGGGSAAARWEAAASAEAPSPQRTRVECAAPGPVLECPTMRGGHQVSAAEAASGSCVPRMSPAEVHMAQTTARAAAWELTWGMGVASTFQHPPPAFRRLGPQRLPPAEEEGAVCSRAALLVEWALSPYLTNPWLLRELQPDVIITQLQPVEGAFEVHHIKAALEEVVGKPVMVVHLDALSLRDVFDDVVRVGRALGAERDAAEASAQMQRRMAVVRAMCSGRPRKRVLCLQWLDPAFTGGAWVPELIRMAGGVPLHASGVQETITSEALVSEESASGAPAAASEAAEELGSQEVERMAAAADVLVLAICGCDIAATLEQVHSLLKAQECAFAQALPFLGLCGPSASRLAPTPQGGSVSDGHRQRCPVAVVDASQLFSRPGPSLVTSLEVLTEILHPEVQRFGHENVYWQYA